MQCNANVNVLINNKIVFHATCLGCSKAMLATEEPSQADSTRASNSVREAVHSSIMTDERGFREGMGKSTVVERGGCELRRMGEE